MDTSNLITKENLRNELAKFATKEDLKNEVVKLATKEDLKGIKADMRELKASDRAIRADLLRLEARIENLEEGQKTILAILVQIQNTLDGFVKGVDDLRTENAIGIYQIKELQIRADDHEKRLTHLESPTA